MTKKTKIIIGFTTLITLGLISLFIFKKPKKDEQQNNNNKEKKDFSVNVVYGIMSIGATVKKIQKYLNMFCNSNLKVDGIWGDKTQKAVENCNLIPKTKDNEITSNQAVEIENKLNSLVV